MASDTNDDINDFMKKESDSSEEHIRTFLKENGIPGLDKNEQLINVVRLVADIPWGKGRNIEEVLVTKKVGTCTGKHLVLQECFDQLGIRYKEVICTFRWGEQGIRFPDDLQSILNKGEWDHGHNFVQVEKDDGTVVDIDITWNQGLRKYGFLALPENWDGKSSFIAVKIKERWDNTDMKAMKIKLIESLPPKIRERREKFLKGFIKWIDSVNKEAKD